MTINSRCNYAGMFGKRIPTRSPATLFSSVFARLGWFGRR
ncbi:hypothetical protein SAMN05216204_111135 [Massilia yuzhufengensis]|uniref:Uncharacterized protein n=1 Tax=Massilia yuzhufengensis TaxID=1164594 RepID=A0A1I1MXK6_9BURK|nr:hypothetical protein SAMN05216204_111135 [Massilia yuzhufengensis]